MSSPVTPEYDCYDSAGGVVAATRILDLIEPSGYHTGLSSSTVYSRRAGLPMLQTPTALPILDNASGWAVGLSRFQGAIWAEATSAVATRKYRFASRFWMPIGEDMSQAPATSQMKLRYQHECVLFRTTPLVALAPLAFGVMANATPSELSDTTAPGYECVSRSDVNGGRWTVRVRLTTAGALTVLADTGINPAVTPQIHIALRYEHLITPRLAFWINGTEYGALSGLAAMPVFGTSLQTIGMIQGLSAGGGAAQLDRSRQSRAWIEEITT